MPFIRVIYSPNLEGEFDVEALCSELYWAARDKGIFPEWGIRAMATKADAAVVGLGDPEHGHIQFFIRVAPGRPRELLQEVVQMFFNVANDRLSSIKTRPVGIQMDMSEFDRELTLTGGNIPSSPATF